MKNNCFVSGKNNKTVAKGDYLSCFSNIATVL